MKNKYICILVCFLFGCTFNQRILTKADYVSSCYLHRYPSTILSLNEDYSFEYKLAYLDEIVTGDWYFNNDTLFLKSDQFKKEFQKGLSPSYKYTEYNDSCDAFLYKRKKLYRLNASGEIDSDCFLRLYELNSHKNP